MMKRFNYFLPILLLSGCIGQDVNFDEVDPVIQITNPISLLELNTFYQLEYMFLDNVGSPIDPTTIDWMSTDESVLTVDDAGLIFGVANGTATITVEAEREEFMASAEITIEVTDDPTLISSERSGIVQTTTSYLLEGDFTLNEDGDSDLILSFASNYEADDGLPGLYVYLTNNPNTISGAYEIGKVSVFSGAHTYNLPNVGLFDYNYVLYYCKPFNVKVGDGTIN